MIETTNGIKLFTKNYFVENPKANILIIHGLHEHCLRYAHVAEALNKIDLNVYTFDLRGHGQSEGLKVNIKNMNEYREDVESVYRIIPKQLPIFILGHSMGGLITTDFLLSNEKTAIKGVILSGAALEIGDDISPILQKIISFLGKIAPNLSTVKVDPKLISRDSEEVDKYIKDPLNYTGGTKAALGSAVINKIKEIKTSFNAFNYPVLIMHGGADKITNIKGSKELFEKAHSIDKIFKEWEGAHHEIFNETNKTDVIKVMCDWIENRI